MGRFRVVARRPTPLERLAALRGQVRTVRRVYAATPRPLRRPDRAAAATLAVVAVWFGGLFAALGWRAAPASAWVATGYLTASLLGLATIALLLTRRPRAAVGSAVGMLVLGQAVALAPVVVALMT